MDNNIKLQLLKQFPLFNGFNDSVLNNIAEVVQVISFKDKEVIYSEGDRADSFFLIAKGKVTLYKKTQSGSSAAVNTLEAGSMFGEISYFSQIGTRSFTAEVHSGTVLVKIPHAFLALIQQSNKITNNLISVMTTKQQKYFTQTANTIEQIQKTADSSIKKAYSNVKPVKTTTSKKTPTAKAVAERNVKNNLRSNDSNITEKNMLYDQKFTCPVCKNKFFSPKVLSKHIKVERTDSDFCNYYKDINPLFYEITVCPRCAYGFSGYKPEKLGNKSLKLISSVLEQLPKKNFCCIRDIDMAIETFIYALTCQQALQSKKSKTSVLNLKLAWLHRYKNDTETEREYIQKALGDYLISFSEEKLNTKSELKVLYIIGDLYNRLGQSNMAITWFNKVVMHPQSKQLPVIVNKAREQWQDIRAQLKIKKSTADEHGSNTNNNGTVN